MDRMFYGSLLFAAGARGWSVVQGFWVWDIGGGFKGGGGGGRVELLALET